MLEIKNLHCKLDDKEILQGLDLTIKPGEVHAIMGPNGNGKSTLAHLLAGKKDYQVKSGEILFNQRDLTKLSISERAQQGLFLAFQYPVEIPGVSSMNFLKSSINSIRKANNEEELTSIDILKKIKEAAQYLDMDENMLKRAVNKGFSGGEKKLFETLQLLLLKPQLVVLDETDSGLDIDALKKVSQAINSLRAENRSFLIITHYQRLLNYIKPDIVHILSKGKIIKSGGAQLANKLEASGYGAFNIDETTESI